MMVNNSLYGNYRTRKFTDIWPTYDSFKTDYVDSALQNITEEDINTLYYLLYARYGNSHIASSDENQFKYQIYSTIWQYGPNWVKQVEIQDKLRALTEKDLIQGSQQIYNSAYNPANVTDVANDELIDTVNEQKTATNKKGKLEAYGLLLSLLKTDVTQEFLTRFKKYFITIVQPEIPLWYVTELEGDEDDNN